MIEKAVERNPPRQPIRTESTRVEGGFSQRSVESPGWELGDLEHPEVVPERLAACLSACLGWGWSLRPAKFCVQLSAVLWVGTWSSDSMPRACMLCTYWSIWGIVRNCKLILGVCSHRAILASIPYKNVISKGVVKKITDWKVNFLPKWMTPAR